MGSIGFEEMLVVAIVAILIYGKQLPGIARKVGQGYSRLKRQVSDMKDEIRRQIPDEDVLNPPEGSSPPDPPGHNPPLPGPDPSDPEYRPAAGPFDPAKPANGNGQGEPKVPEPGTNPPAGESKAAP
jgi:sec-independent protein translocase protein TatA